MFQHASISSCAAVHAVTDWSRVVRVARSDDGSGGVMFAHFRDGSVLVRFELSFFLPLECDFAHIHRIIICIVSTDPGGQEQQLGGARVLRPAAGARARSCDRTARCGSARSRRAPRLLAGSP